MKGPAPDFRACPADGVAFVTGASSGIGRAVAARLAEQGYTVAVSARRAAELDALAKTAPRIFSFPGDTTDAGAMSAVIAAVEAAHGPIALAFLNAGVYFPAERERIFDAGLARRTFEVNVGGTINCLGPLLDSMKGRGRGQIAITASLAGYGGIPGSLAYGASKAALIYMAEVLRMGCAPGGLTIQIVNPGFVETPMTAPNEYGMPFIMSAESAARIICAGFSNGGFEIAFPRRLAYVFKVARLLPYSLLFPLMRRAARRASGEG